MYGSIVSGVLKPAFKSYCTLLLHVLRQAIEGIVLETVPWGCLCKVHIEDAYGGSSPHPLQTVRITSKFGPKFIEILTFFDDFGVLGAPRADLAKKLEKCSQKLTGEKSIWGSIFDNYRQKVGIGKSTVFSDPAFSTENRPRGPQSRHHGRSGARKAPEMEPKMMTFRGPAET